MDIIDFWNLAQYIEDLISYWFFMSCRPRVSFVASITLGAWGGLAVLQLFLRKHLMVCSESTECQNTINCSLNHYTVKLCDLDLWETTTCNWSVVSVLETYVPFTNHGPDLWLNMVMFCIVVQCCPIYTASMPSRHYISIIMQLKKCCNYGPGL